jgi:hypothetical protein
MPKAMVWLALGYAPPLFISKYITKEIYLEKTKMVNNLGPWEYSVTI